MSLLRKKIHNILERFRDVVSKWATPDPAPEARAGATTTPTCDATIVATRATSTATAPMSATTHGNYTLPHNYNPRMQTSPSPLFEM